MVDAERKRRKKKLKQLMILDEGEKENQPLLELTEVLEDLKQKGKLLDIQICPRCKSPAIRRVNSMLGDMSGHIGLTPPKYECLRCGWRNRLVLNATNRSLDVKEVEIMADATDFERLDN